MRFGEYLIETGFVSQQAVLDAIAIQERERPYLPQLAVELGMIRVREALRLIDLADEQQTSFIGAAKLAGVLDALAIDQLQAESESRTRPIGRILLELGALTREELPRHLKEYFRLRRENAPFPLELAPQSAGPS